MPDLGNCGLQVFMTQIGKTFILLTFLTYSSSGGCSWIQGLKGCAFHGNTLIHGFFYKGLDSEYLRRGRLRGLWQLSGQPLRRESSPAQGLRGRGMRPGKPSPMQVGPCAGAAPYQSELPEEERTSIVMG